MTWEPSSHWEVKLEPIEGTWVTIHGADRENIDRLYAMLVGISGGAVQGGTGSLPDASGSGSPTGAHIDGCPSQENEA